uniref:Nucleotide-diphospho-sugar transferase domain-containing protein n=1 Tax=Plectus sambesii TaxID=2011161 RepID=A0A914X534_9BILA
MSSTQKRFSFAEGAYQVIYLLRANLASSLVRYGRSFWMMQQDTFWRENLFELNLESGGNFDLLFDQIGDSTDSQRAEWVNGANFYVRANNRTLEFFQSMASKLAHWYTPDMAIMIHQCHTWGNQSNCNFMPHRIAHSWEWMYTAQKNPPYIMQLDCETDAGSKLDQLAKFGFRFTQDDGRTCNQAAVEQARERMNMGTVDVRRAMLSWGRFQFIVYWYITDFLLWLPIVGQLIKPYLPLVGFCIMITF